MFIQIFDVLFLSEYCFFLDFLEGGEVVFSSDGVVMIFDVNGELVSGFCELWVIDVEGNGVFILFWVEG